MSQLSDKQITNAKPREEPYFLYDGLGLQLRVKPNGAKQFFYRYTYAARRKTMSLGTYPAVKLTDARRRRMDQEELLQNGKDPGEVQRTAIDEKAEGLTMEELGARFRDIHLAGTAGYEHPEVEYAFLERDVMPAIGKLLVADVKPAHMTRVFDKMIKRGAKVAANRCLSLSKKLFDFAIDHEHAIVENPCARLTAKKVGGTEQSRKVNLLFDQLRDVLLLLNRTDHGLEPETVLGLKLIAGTGKRPGEVVTLEWSEVDLRGRWLNPAAKTKEKRDDHVVFLNEWTLALLREQRERHPKAQYVLPSFKKARKGREAPAEAHIDRHTLSRALNRLRERGVLKLEFTPHDLRRTFSSRMADLRVPFEVVEKCLDHLMTGTASVYNRSTYFPERKAAMDLWGKTLADLENGTLPPVSGE